MSAKPIVRNAALLRLLEEGYEIEVREQHLLVHAVPYVAANRTIKLGTLVCTYIESAGAILPPDNHQVWFTGEYPCFSDGRQIQQIANENNRQELINGCWINHRFSNKPYGLQNFSDHYSKMVHYITLLSDQARVIEPTADARTRRYIEAAAEESVFKYADTCSARAGIVMTSARLKPLKIAIVGLGGTGAYILDQSAKTPAREIHLFDGDVFKQHNAFRAPGAASIEDIYQQLPKTAYFKKMYDAMRDGIFSHEYFIDEDNVMKLGEFDFVFVCVDKGPARQLICLYLISMNIPFIDVGMSVEVVPETQRLVATCRFTVCTPDQKEHFDQHVPVMDDDEDALYRQNIQVADMNAMNAILAVMKWKQLFGFYQDDFKSHHGTFSVSSHSLTRDVMRLGSAP